ncbi:segregation and condensation protein A [Varibaculum vaginae]|uniref:segregation and condensation protein A n=1 Tax=Varibaculum vaginae TaxID=2364797 RepID=UPI00135A8F10|nr:ScpA family protein [Varibaculum vaginae]
MVTPPNSPAVSDNPQAAGGEDTGLFPPELVGNAEPGKAPPFELELEVFSGPLDLLLTLIIKNKLDITEVALAQVTDDFIAYMQAFPDLSQASQFLEIAATLLNIKASQLLPGEETEELDPEYLEARDLLFSRLLQYRAYKEVAEFLRERIGEGQAYYPREVPLPAKFARLLPPLRVDFTPEDLARAAAEAFTRRPPQVSLSHLHLPQASLAEQAQIVVAELKRHGKASFSELTRSAKNPTEIVTRFLALLELYRRRCVEFTQENALEELYVTLETSEIPDFTNFIFDEYGAADD